MYHTAILNFHGRSAICLRKIYFYTNHKILCCRRQQRPLPRAVVHRTGIKNGRVCIWNDQQARDNARSITRTYQIQFADGHRLHAIAVPIK